MGSPWTPTHQDSDRMGFPLGELRKGMRRPNRIARDKGDISHPNWSGFCIRRDLIARGRALMQWGGG